MMTSSAAVLWNKKKYKVEGSKQVQNVDVPSPTSSPSLWTDREIESTPKESLVQCTNLHFGERPDLKSELYILFSLIYILKIYIFVVVVIWV